MTHRAPAAVLCALMCAGAPGATGTAQSSPPQSVRGEEFPPEDFGLWLFLERGLKNETADVQLAKAPDSSDTLARLVEAYRPADALIVLRRIIDRRPERMASAFKALASGSHQFQDEGREYPARLREAIAAARKRLPELSREQGAEAEWAMLHVDVPEPGTQPIPWQDRVRRFMTAYEGTEAALLAERSLWQSRDLSERVAVREEFARRYAGTAAGAMALYDAAFDLAHNGREPRGSDPTDRFLRVAALAHELESGAFPDCEWVRRAPDLVTGFHAYHPTYSPANLTRVIAIYEDTIKRHFSIDPVKTLSSGSGYTITTPLADLVAMTEEGGPTGVERLLTELEREPARAAAVRYLRGLFYRKIADSMTGEDAEGWRQKSRTTLESLARDGGGLYNRKALATLASQDFVRKDCAAALSGFRDYVARYPRSEWAWVAGLRIGQCEQMSGRWADARAAFTAVASIGAGPVPIVFGHTLSGHASEALGQFDLARRAYERATRAWDPRYEDPFGLYQFQTRFVSECYDLCTSRGKPEVGKRWLEQRAAQLKRSATIPGGALLERGRWLVSEERWADAIVPLTEFVQMHPQASDAADADELAARAKLEIALAHATPDASDADVRGALASLESLSGQPYGFSVFATKVARATLQWIVGEQGDAEALMLQALSEWHERGLETYARDSFSPLQQDVVDIRQVVFQPRGGELFGKGWNAFDWQTPAQGFAIVKPDVRVTLHDGSVIDVRSAAGLAGERGRLLLDSEQIAVFERILTTLGGTKRRAPQAIMETPNQPVGRVQDIQKFWNEFFAMRPGHWGGWIFETFPIVNGINFVDAARTRAAAKVRIGYSGCTVLLEKVDGRWRATRLSGQWIE